jgi:hypothetical protein
METCSPSDQQSLFKDKPKRIKLSREEGFNQFHQRNPEVYRILVLRAFNMKRYGCKSYSMRTLWEVLRWELDRKRMKNPASEKYELNDHWPPFYARLIMAEHPELQGFFETRGRKP